MVIKFKYDFFEFVYLTHDPDQGRMQITSVKVEPGGVIYYYLNRGSLGIWAHEQELSETKDDSFLVE